MTDRTEQERAASWADDIEQMRMVLVDASYPNAVIRDADKVLPAALRALASRPAIPEDVREGVAKAISSEGIHGAFRRNSDSVEAIRAWDAMKAVPDDDWRQIFYAIQHDAADEVLSYLTSIGWGPKGDGDRSSSDVLGAGHDWAGRPRHV